jgi:hypothetical protein
VDLWPTVEENISGDVSGGGEKEPGKSNSSAAALAAQKAAIIAHDAANVDDGAFAAVEIPGQYEDLATKPSSELKTRLLKFAPVVQIEERGDELVRRIGMQGSDGVTHFFTLHACTAAVINDEVGGEELSHFLNRTLNTDLNCLKRQLSFVPRSVAPLSQRMMLREEAPLFRRLTEVENLEAWVRSTLGTPEQIFTFRKTFARTLAALVLKNFALAASQSEIVFDSNGIVTSLSFNPNYSLAGLLEDVDMQIEVGVRTFLGELMIQGVMVPALATMASALDKSRALIEPALDLFLTENLVDWHASKSGSKTDLDRKKAVKALHTRVAGNKSLVQERIAKLSLKDGGGGEIDRAAGEFCGEYLK